MLSGTQCQGNCVPAKSRSVSPALATMDGNQFVPDCSQRRFTVFHGWDSGFGSEMHVIGTILAYAIEHNITLLLTRKACKFFASPALCKLGCECVLGPISNCKHSKV